jgi:hypothetical protein
LGSEADTSDEEREDPGSEHPSTESAEDDESIASDNEGSGSFVFKPATRTHTILPKGPDLPKADRANGSVTGKLTNDTSCHQAERRARIGK